MIQALFCDFNSLKSCIRCIRIICFSCLQQNPLVFSINKTTGRGLIQTGLRVDCQKSKTLLRFNI